MEFWQTTGDKPMVTALSLLTDHRRKLALLSMLSFLALC